MYENTIFYKRFFVRLYILRRNDKVSNYKEKSIYDTGVTAHYGDRLLTLVTCASYTDEGRFVVVAREKKN